MFATAVPAKAAEASAAPAGKLNDSLLNAHQQVRSLFVQTESWIVHNSLQIAIAVGAGVLIALALLGIKALGMRLCREGRGGHWRLIVGRMFAKTSFWFCVIVAVRLVDGYADAPPMVDRTIGFLFTVIVTFQCALWAREFVLGFIEHRAGADEHAASGLSSAIGIVRLLVSFALFAIATVLVLDNVGVNVTGLIAGLGIGGIAIGLAAQGIFADLFAALAIIFDRPFRRGDGIAWNGTSGSVEEIGLKSTRVRALTGEMIVIANKQLLDKELHNFARLDRRRMKHKIGVTYQTAPEVCTEIPDIVRTIIEAQGNCRFLRCGMTGFGDSSLDFELQFDVNSANYEEVFGTNSRVCIAILAEFNRRGIEFAYPTQTTFTAAPDGRTIMPYPENALVPLSPTALQTEDAR